LRVLGQRAQSLRHLRTAERRRAEADEERETALTGSRARSEAAVSQWIALPRQREAEIKWRTAKGLLRVAITEQRSARRRGIGRMRPFRAVDATGKTAARATIPSNATYTSVANRSDCVRARRELFFGCKREMKKHCIQIYNLKLTLDLDGDRFGL
jgi:hypothetical protein